MDAITCRHYSPIGLQITLAITTNKAIVTAIEALMARKSLTFFYDKSRDGCSFRDTKLNTYIIRNPDEFYELFVSTTSQQGIGIQCHDKPEAENGTKLESRTYVIGLE